MKRLAPCLVLLAACSGGNSGARPVPTTPTPQPSASVEPPAPMRTGPCDDVLSGIGVPAEIPLLACSKRADARCLPEADLHRLGVAYSGYRTGQDPRAEAYPSEDEIRVDLALLLKRGYSLIRLFDSTEHAARVLKVIRADALDVKVQLGVWIDGAKDGFEDKNQADITRGVALANDYKDIIIGVSVGNETLDDWSSVHCPPADLAGYIAQVRPLVTQPVTTDDMYPPYELGGTYTEVIKVVEQIDYVSLHVYSFIDAQWSWDYKQEAMPAGPQRSQAMMAAGIQFTKEAVRSVRYALTSSGHEMPIVIGEAGWKSEPSKPGVSGEQFRAHPLNQAQFYRDFMSWVAGPTRDKDSPEAAMWFAAFDEPWKGQDDGWGLFDTNRHPKYVVSCSYPDMPSPDPFTYAPEDALYYKE